MKTFENLEELISHTAGIHRKAAELYRAIGSEIQNTRLQMMLDSMYEHTVRMEKLFLEFKNRAGAGTLNTYLQYTLEESRDDYMDSLKPQTTTPNLKDISDLGQKIHHYLVEILEGALRETASETAQTLLRDLLQLEKAEQRNFTRSIAGTYQL